MIPTGSVGTAQTTTLLNNSLSIGYAVLQSEAPMIGAKAGGRLSFP